MTRCCLLVSCCLAVFTLAVRAQERTIYRIDVSGPVEVALSDLVTGVLQQAQTESDAVVVLNIGSSGGRMDIAQLIVQDVASASVPVYALVNERAWQAAALIALSADSIFVVADASIGAGTAGSPERRQMPPAALRALRDNFGSMAARHGVDAEIGTAMVDEGVQVRGLVRRGELLTLSADAAVESGLAAGHVVDVDDLMTVLSIAQPIFEVVGEPGNEAIALEIVNYHLSDVRVLLLRGGVRYRLGMVTTNSSRSFEVDQSVLPEGARIRVAAEVIGGSGRTQTEEIRVRPGLVIQWTIETRLSQSNLFYFVR